MRIGSLFSGYGGLDLAVEQVWGAEPAWVAEMDPAPARVLAHHWPTVPNLGDITAVDWAAVEQVDILTGGFPCQDVSHAGKRAGIQPGTRSGLWTHMAYAIDQLRPPLVVIENVRGLLSATAASDVEPCPWCVGDAGSDAVLRALGAVLGTLAELGYDAQWATVPASAAGAPHRRERVFLTAHPAADAGRVCGQVPARGGLPAVPVTGGEGPQGGTGVTLLPTPVASDGPHGGPGMRARHGNGNGHGPSLAIEAQRVDQWGAYAPAAARWEQVLGRPAPAPTEQGRTGPVLSPPFVEWMMGLPPGWVTAPTIGLTRAQQLKALGNGVVPQQAAHALRILDGMAA